MTWQGDDFLPDSRLALRRRALLGFQALLYRSGAVHAFLLAKRPAGAVILMYHSVASPGEEHWVDPRNRIARDLFERQMRFLASHRNVISLGELIRMIADGDSPRAGSVVITFDDGYRDNLEIAAPILERYELPATLYLPTGLVSRGESPWADELYSAFRMRTRGTLYGWQSSQQTWCLDRLPSARAAFAEASGALLAADPEERLDILDRVRESLAPEEPSPRLTLDWDELRDLRQRFPRFEIGVHSTNHIDLTAFDEDVVEHELQTSLEDVEANLDFRPRDFAYPYNRGNSRTRAIVARSGFRSAVTYAPDCLISAGADPLALSRIDAPHNETLFRLWTSGAQPALSKMLTGRV